MAKESRWLRLNVDWDDSPWLFTLSEGSQLAWIKFLCYVKALGSAGKVKALEPLIASRKWAVGEESVSKMLQAGINDGAIVAADGLWIVCNWHKYQGKDETNAERQKRYRESKREPEGPEKPDNNAVTSNDAVTESNAVTLSRDRDRDRDSDRDNKKNQPPANLGGREDGFDFDSWFSDWLKIYPKRPGESSQHSAKNRLRALWQEGRNMAEILDGTKRFAGFVKATARDSKYLPSMMTFLKEERWMGEFEIPTAEPDTPEEIDYRTFDPGLGKRPKAWFVARDMPLPIYLVPHAVGHVEEVRRFLAKHGDVGRKLLESEGIQIPIEEAS